ncbi:hypothetical protein LTR08_000356 [Meristemomyces frigidus]|nr:hypothetical protein LTR08_000356 [Meristemomyces frigidus]
MTLKRKRSSQAISSPSVSATSAVTIDSAASIPFFYQHSKPVEPLQQKPTWAWPTYDDSPSSGAQHLNSRTRKRHRDDRPDEEAVYAATMEKLFDAQRRHLDLQPAQPSTQILHPAPTATATAAAPHQNSTLHSFWRLPPHAHPRPFHPVDLNNNNSSTALTETREPQCEDCERPLQHADAMEMDTGMWEQEQACAACGRRVCDVCAVMGDARICLGCAGG